jgi:cytoskeleton protein RodZ
VFVIGSSLREARIRQELDFPEIEQATKIRVKHLQALEEEQFELLPGQTYVKGFLRTYAEYLGLDGQLYVDEFNSRYATGEEEPVPIARTNVGSRPLRVESRLVLFVLLGIAAVTAFVILAWKSGGGNNNTNAPVPPAGDTTTANPTPPPKKHKHKQTKPKPPPRVRLILNATNGPSWIWARAGSSNGKQLYEGTLQTGQTLPLPQTGKVKRIWLNVGQPENLTWTLNGKSVPPPSTSSGYYFMVGPKGVTSSTSTA